MIERAIRLHQNWYFPCNLKNLLLLAGEWCKHVTFPTSNFFLSESQGQNVARLCNNSETKYASLHVRWVVLKDYLFLKIIICEERKENNTLLLVTRLLDVNLLIYDRLSRNMYSREKCRNIKFHSKTVFWQSEPAILSGDLVTMSSSTLRVFHQLLFEYSNDSIYLVG